MKKKKINIGDALLMSLCYVVLIIVTIITLFPILYSIFGSFKETQELMKDKYESIMKVLL